MRDTAFGDTPAMRTALAWLVAVGRKRATAALLRSYEEEAEPLPCPDDLERVLDGDGVPVCVIRIDSVTISRFDAVDAAFAAAEGEGDGSLAFWQSEHRAFFTRDRVARGETFHPAMLVVLTRFTIVAETLKPGAPPG